MIFKKVFHITLIVCILSLFLYQNVSFAGMTGETHGNKWVAEKDELGNKWDDVNRSVTEYHSMREHMVTLINEWSATEAAVKKGRQTVVFRGGAAILAAGAAYLSGGSLAPAAWLAYYALEEGVKTITLDSDKYIEVMGSVISVMDTARSNVDAAYNGGGMSMKVNGVETQQSTIGYDAQYKKYIKMCADHGLAQMVDGNIGKTAISESNLDIKVNMENVTRNWYHAGETSPSSGEHVIGRKAYLSDWKVKPDLERKYKCKGYCTDKFRSPHEALTAHRKKCGTEPFTIHAYTLKRRTVQQGCGAFYYTCGSGFSATVTVNKHKVRTCQKWVYTYDSHFKNRYIRTRCHRQFRVCMGQLFDHNPRVPGTTWHSETSAPPHQATVPSRPGSFSLTPGRISIQLRWTDSDSDGGSAITAYEFQYQSSTNGRRSWSSWSEWVSGGTDNFHLIQGLKRGTDYAVRMRAVNDEGPSRETGIKIIKTLGERQR